MTQQKGTKIFGLRLGVDPKILVGGLIVIAVILFWYNSRTEDSGAPASASVRTSAVPEGSSATGGNVTTRANPARRISAANNQGILRMRPIDATKGDVDPTLHLGLLRSLSGVQEGKIGRSVFEIGAAQAAGTLPVIKAPKIPVAPVVQPTTPVANIPPPVNIPLKYYGYAKPGETAEANRGLFLDDSESVLVATEGMTIKGHYLVVELTPRQARIEDTQMRQSKDLPVMPVAQP